MRVRVTVDRDSVTMGDDAVSHDRVLEVPGETTLGAFLAHMRPGVSVGGGSGTWVVRVDGDWVGMYAEEQMRVLRDADRTLADLQVTTVRFDYWASAPPELLLESLLSGRLPDREAMRQEGYRRHWAAEDATARERAGATTDRLLGPDTVAAVGDLGGRIEVHAPSYCRLVAADGQQYVVRHDGYWGRIARVDEAGDQRQLATFQPPGPLAETTLVALLGEAWRAAAGRAPVDPPDAPRRRRPEVQRTGGIWRCSWTEDGVLHEARFWPDGSLAGRYAPYLRMDVPAVTAHFHGGDVRQIGGSPARQ